jgi:hypothetical protein
MSWVTYKQIRDSKKLQMQLIEDQIRLLNTEIELRKKMVDQLYGKYQQLMDQGQELANLMLKHETESLIKAGI